MSLLVDVPGVHLFGERCAQPHQNATPQMTAIPSANHPTTPDALGVYLFHRAHAGFSQP